MAHIVVILAGNIAIVGCLFFLLTIFMKNTTLLASEIQSYLFDFEKPLLIGHPQLNGNEERHLLDVKRILQSTSWMILLAATLAISALFLLSQQQTIIKYIGKIGLISLTSIIISLSVSGFYNGFVWLHSLLFPTDTWWFGSESTLIQLYPLSFFQEFVLIYLTLATLIFSLCWWFNRNSPVDQPAYTENQPPDNRSESENH